MKTKLKALVGLTYPVGASLRKVRRAGGWRNLSQEQRAGIEVKHVEPGEFCDDLPQASRAAFIAAGKVREVADVLGDLSADEAVEYIEQAPGKHLSALEAEERDSANPRVTVLRAIEKRGGSE